MFRTEAEQELELKKLIFAGQVLAIASLIISGIVVWIANTWFAGFFPYHYFETWSVRKDDLYRFWPLFAYGGFMACISSLWLRSTRLDRALLGWGTLTSVLAGIWEELGYRWLFICTAMIGIVWGNWLLSTFLGLIAGGGIALFGLSVLGNRKIPANLLVGLLLIPAGIGLAVLCWQSDPLFWLYDNVVVPVVNFVTFGTFGSIFYNPGYPKLFVFGMIAANAKFRDGHKYQGPLGMLNAWVIGFIMMWAMLRYGLMTAVVLHALYDIEITVIRYFARKADQLRSATA